MWVGLCGRGGRWELRITSRLSGVRRVAVGVFALHPPPPFRLLPLCARSFRRGRSFIVAPFLLFPLAFWSRIVHAFTDLAGREESVRRNWRTPQYTEHTTAAAEDDFIFALIQEGWGGKSRAHATMNVLVPPLPRLGRSDVVSSILDDYGGDIAKTRMVRTPLTAWLSEKELPPLPPLGEESSDEKGKSRIFLGSAACALSVTTGDRWRGASCLSCPLPSSTLSKGSPMAQGMMPRSVHATSRC